MRNNLWKFICILTLSLFFVSCGGDGDKKSSGSGESPTTGNEISGLAATGLISGGTVSVYAVTDDGQKGSLLGSATTASDGSYTVDVGDYTGPVLVEITGGTYLDEATGETKTLDTTLRAALDSVSGDVTVAVTPLTEIAVRMAEAGNGLDAVKIKDANELLSQLISADIISTLPADINDSTEFGAASDDTKNYALLLAAISQISETSGLNLSGMIAYIEDDMADLEIDETSADLLSAINTFLASGENNSGVDNASSLVTIIDEIVTNGLQPTGDLAEAKTYLAAFLNSPTDANYTSFMNYMSTFVAESEESYLFKAIATLMDIYTNDASAFMTVNGLNLDDLLNSTFNSATFKQTLLNLSTIDTDIAALFSEMESRLEDVNSDLTNAEGVNTFISLTGFDTVYLDDIDVKTLKTITSVFQSFCILVQAIDLHVDNWMVDSGSTDARTLIGNEIKLTDAQETEFLTNNPDFLKYSDTTKLASFITAFETAADNLQTVATALDALGASGRALRVKNAFNIDSDLDFYKVKAMSEEAMPSILTAMGSADASIVIPEGKDNGEGSIILADDGYSYYQTENDIYLNTYSKSSDITFYSLFTGAKSMRDLTVWSRTNTLDLYAKGTSAVNMEDVADIEWDNPVDSYTVPSATITIDGDASDWDSVPYIQSASSGESLPIKIARGSDNIYYVYLSVSTELNDATDRVGCGIAALWPWTADPTGESSYVAHIDATGVSVLTGSEIAGGPPPTSTSVVADADKSFIASADGTKTGIEMKFSHFDWVTGDNYYNRITYVASINSEPPDPAIVTMKLY